MSAEDARLSYLILKADPLLAAPADQQGEGRSQSARALGGKLGLNFADTCIQGN